jgi:hypothetical protein
VQGRDGLLDSVSVISGADTVLGSFKSPELSGKHGAADQTRHGLPACDWSLHGVESERAAQTKTVEELEEELMAVFEDALSHGTVRLTDRACDHTCSSTHQSHPRLEASQKAHGFRGILWTKLGLQRLIGAGSPGRSEPVCPPPPPPVLATGLSRYYGGPVRCMHDFCCVMKRTRSRGT